MSVLSYSGLNNRSKITLPGVDSWGSNQNILRDPVRSVSTRRVDKVGQTSEITTMIDESFDRISGLNEFLLQYPRGVNPMVGVDYNNNNGGTSGRIGKGSQSFLPYRIMQAGAFRPPIRDPRDLLPLSRLPRTATSSFTNPGFADFSKKAMCHNPEAETKGVRNHSDMLRPCVSPTAVYRIDDPTRSATERTLIKKTLSVPVTSGVQENKKVAVSIGKIGKQLRDGPIPESNVNKSSHYSKSADSKIDVERYTHVTLKGEYGTNTSRNLHITPIDDVVRSSTEQGIRDSNVITHNTIKTGFDKTEYIHTPVVMDRVLPQYEMTSQVSKNIHKSFDHHQAKEYTPNRPAVNIDMDRARPERVMEERQDYTLKPTLSLGGFESTPNLPEVYHDNQEVYFDHLKQERRKKVYDLHQERNASINGMSYSPMIIGQV